MNLTDQLIRTETEYTANGNYVTKQKDARGNEVTNTLDENGRVLSVTDPAGQSVGYTYDASNRVTKVETAYTQDGQSRVSKNEYTYEDDRISTVSHNTTDNDTCDVQYKFHYDALGRKTSVTVSNGSEGAPEQALSTNVYSADRKSRLEEVQYGNGGKVSYTYDDFDRVTGVTHDDDTDPKFTYEYDAKTDGMISFGEYFKDEGLFTGEPIHPYYSKYDYTMERPCAWFVETMLGVMGLKDEFATQIGSMLKPKGDNSKYKGKKKSTYLRAHEYADKYGIKAGDIIFYHGLMVS